MKLLKYLFLLIWTFEWFGNLYDLQSFLNKLPEERALEAKIVTAFPEKFNENTYWDKGYYLFYRIEEFKRTK